MPKRVAWGFLRFLLTGAASVVIAAPTLYKPVEIRL
jgi:hypothetical protein